MSASKIEWTGQTWNPVVGCDKVSAGCKNCYAMRMAWRLQHNPKLNGKYAGTATKTAGGQINWTGKINLDYAALDYPLQVKKPTIFFVNSMSDLFHEDIPFVFIDSVFTVMSVTERHTYQILTKRPERAIKFIEWKRTVSAKRNWQPSQNIWLGVSVENQQTADERIPLLLEIPAFVKFLSCEPLLGPIDLAAPINDTLKMHAGGLKNCLNWVICGGESGPGARPMHPAWARSLRDQCATAGIPFFFKQWGEWHPRHINDFTVKEDPQCTKWQSAFVCRDGSFGARSSFSLKKEYNGYFMSRTGKKAAGRLLDGVEHNAMPQTSFVNS